MIRTLPLMLFALPVAAQDAGQEVVGALTATIDAEERTYVVAAPGEEPASGFERRGDVTALHIVARPDRTPSDDTPVLELRFDVTGTGPTADATNARVTYTGPDGSRLTTGEGAAEVSLTAFGSEEEEVTASGFFSSQLRADASGPAELAIEGDFQASLRQSDFAAAE